MANEKTTTPVGCNVSFEAYCSELGIDLQESRQRTLTQSIRDMLTRQDEALSNAGKQAKNSR